MVESMDAYIRGGHPPCGNVLNQKNKEAQCAKKPGHDGYHGDGTGLIWAVGFWPCKSWLVIGDDMSKKNHCQHPRGHAGVHGSPNGLNWPNSKEETMRFPHEVTDWSEIKVGDKIEVTYSDTGDVNVFSLDSVGKDWAQGRRVHTHREALLKGTTSIRILSRSKPDWKVGDVIRADQVKELPAYSTISTHRDHPGHSYGIPAYWTREAGEKNRWRNLTHHLDIDFDSVVSNNQGYLTYTIKQIGPWA